MPIYLCAHRLFEAIDCASPHFREQSQSPVFEVNNTLDNNTNQLSTNILLSYILHCIKTSATYKNITMEHVIMESGQL